MAVICFSNEYDPGLDGYGYGDGYGNGCPPHAAGVHVQIQNEDREGFIFATAAEPHF